MSSERKKRTLVVGLAIAATALAGYLIGRARASGIPMPAMTYSGTLEDLNGVALTGTKSIQIQLFDQLSGGTVQCSVGPAGQTLLGGQFQIILPDSCTAAVHAHPDLWVEVSVDGTSLGRTKLTTVPYAVEADHAQTASAAASDFTVPGRLGVATPSPAAALEVNVASKTSNQNGAIVYSNSYNNPGFVTGNGALATFSGYQRNNDLTDGNSYGAAFGLNSAYDGTNWSTWNGYVKPQTLLMGINPAGTTNGFHFLTSNGLNQAGTAGTYSPNEAMTITDSGNVGIGNSTPTAQLDVGGDFRFSKIASGSVVPSPGPFVITNLTVPGFVGVVTVTANCSGSYNSIHRYLVDSLEFAPATAAQVQEIGTGIIGRFDTATRVDVILQAAANNSLDVAVSNNSVGSCGAITYKVLAEQLQ